MFLYRIPGMRLLNNSATNSINYNSQVVTFDAIGDGIAWIYQIPESATITKVGIRINNKTVDTLGVMRVSLQGVTSTGLPDGTILSSGAGYVDFTNWSSVTQNSFVELTLGQSVSITRGQRFAIVAEAYSANGSNTFNVDNTLGVSSIIGNLDIGNVVPYHALNTAGTWARSNQRGQESFYIKSATRTYGMPMSTAEILEAVSSTREVGLRINIPSVYGQQVQLDGVQFMSQYISQTTPTDPIYTLNIYNWNNGANSTALESVDITAMQVANTTNNQRGAIELLFDDSTPVFLTTGQDYIVSLATTTGTAKMAVAYYTIADADKNAWFSGTWDYVARTSSTGSWSTTAGRWPCFELIVGDVVNAGGGYAANFNQGFGG